MKLRRSTVGVTTLWVALATGFGPAHAHMFDVSIDNPNITVLQPAPGAKAVPFFFEVSVHNNSSYDFDFEFAFDDMFNQIGGVGIPNLYQGPDFAEAPLLFTDLNGVLTQGPVLMSLKGCGDGISLVCLHPNETFVGNIAYGFVESTTLLGLYAVTQDGQSPATMTFQGTYMVNGTPMSYTQKTSAFSVNVATQNAVPEAHPWVLMMAGLASVLLISSRRIRG